MNIQNFGHHAGLMQHLPYFYPNKGMSKFMTEAVDKFKEEVQSLINTPKYKYIVCTTANYFQEHARKVLKELGFRPVKSFYSSHDDPRETLTIWIKIINVDVNELSPNNTLLDDCDYTSNCSVKYSQGLDDDDNKQCSLFTSDNKPDGCKKIKNTPIYFKIKESAMLEADLEAELKK